MSFVKVTVHKSLLVATPERNPINIWEMFTLPQLVKGGKWTYGWIVMDSEGQLPIPPSAWNEYEFTAKDDFIVVPASRKSGGFAITTKRRFDPSVKIQVLGTVFFEKEYLLRFPFDLLKQMNVGFGERFLTVRGSDFAQACMQKGPIVEEALTHLDLVVFHVEDV